ncbi:MULTISPECIES: DUF2867 domain-containing protein [unclassified Acinetobacter]|uniref:DUF2867 domain-containing protein n=1 Tax=unclassified Acinetobacter TaxID=196816 RepID=UPI002934869C|nr:MULTISPECIES: DUF2867 domain-containing protein [unclassified Acinetobacter]WOE32482.1 DUF2867 domain-containing protein [Acinetobacter sp. SAAs470]WOE37958.1 DUF2867 domain-containing protein [Acinetobacter sp. SAAs474]
MNHKFDTSNLVAPLQELNFFHKDHTLINTDITAIQAYQIMTQQSSVLLNIAFKIRDDLSYRLNRVKPIKGFGASMGEIPKLNQKLDFFDVVKISDQELFLQSTDKHLSVLVAIQIEQYQPNQNILKITTSVITYNFFGKIYMLPVSVAHGIIVRNMLKKLN